MPETDHELTARLWREQLPASGALPELALRGHEALLPSPFHVDSLATASIALAAACAAGLWSVRTGKSAAKVALDRTHAAAAFRSERYAKLLAREPIPAWDPIAGDYETRDGFIRLHTNYRPHRAAVLRVLGVSEDRSAVAQAVKNWRGEALELRVVEAGGAAALLRERAAFRGHAQGIAIAGEPLLDWSFRKAVRPLVPEQAWAPLAGVRVLDLTRVIAGPVCTRFLAGYGADVLRIDPVGFEEVPALLPDTTAGKRRAALDLHSAAGREQLERLLTEAHVLVVGYRPDAIMRLGFSADRRAQLNPSLVTVTLDAYGYRGPWAARRGFDSLVQMSTGIAAFGRSWRGCQKPYPLPAQALDHATGYFAAAAACHGLTRALCAAEGCEVRLSLSATAELLWQLGTDPAREGRELTDQEVAPYLETADSAWGRTERLRCPAVIGDYAPHWSLPAGQLGSDEARFVNAS